MDKINSRQRINNRIVKGITLIIFFLISSVSRGQESEVLLRTDFNGKVVEGSLDVLIETIQKGDAIRIGWQLDFNDDNIPDLEHWINGKFLTIMNGHVFNQIDPIYAQAPMSEIPQVEISNSPLQWTAIIGTNGKLISRYIFPDLDKITDESFRKEMEKMLEPSERMVQTIWVKK